MLILSRKVGESIIIDNNIKVTVIEIRGNRIRFGFDAPSEVPIRRSELDKNSPLIRTKSRPNPSTRLDWLNDCFENLAD